MLLHFFIGGLFAVSLQQGSGGSDRNRPDRQLVYKVEGLTCPAVAGLGCGHLLAPELARLDKLEGVESSFANRTGTMIRVTVAAVAERDKVAAAVSKYLVGHKRAPVRLVGKELQSAIDKEEWRETRRIAELSGIEFRTLSVDQVRDFAKSEKLHAKRTGKLVELAGEEWDRTAGQAIGDVKAAAYSKDWSARCTRFAASFAGRAKGLLTAEQHARLKERLMCCCPSEGPKAK